MTLAPPSTQKQYTMAEKLIEGMNQEAGLQGYALRKDIYKKDKRGELRKIWLACDGGGKFKTVVNENERKRQQTSRACGCPWKGYALRLEGIEGPWSLVLKNDSHNHPPTRAEAHPLLRQLSTNDVAFISNETRRQIDPHLTTTELRTQNPERPLKRKDVYNARTKAQAKESGHLTSI
ncbi:hypothetical protein MMC22_008524 [Lobaria immixta]|nr:hypothetical protein [Lobaria immixta]